MRTVYFLPIALVMVLCMTTIQGCKKKGLDKTIVTIINRLDHAVTLDLYASAEDYAANNNLQNRLVIEAHESLTLPGDNFMSDVTYYMDWYSEDYYYNNWYNDDYPTINGSRVRIKPVAGNNTYYLEPTYKGNARKSFLKGSSDKTGWIAIGAYLYAGSTGYSNQWSELTINERYRQITVNKNFIADYSYKDAAGNLKTESLEFLVQQSEEPYIEFHTATGAIGGNMTGGKLPSSTLPDYKSYSVDTVMALFPDNEYIFMMVRQ